MLTIIVGIVALNAGVAIGWTLRHRDTEAHRPRVHTLRSYDGTTCQAMPREGAHR